METFWQPGGLSKPPDHLVITACGIQWLTIIYYKILLYGMTHLQQTKLSYYKTKWYLMPYSRFTKLKLSRVFVRAIGDYWWSSHSFLWYGSLGCLYSIPPSLLNITVIYQFCISRRNYENKIHFITQSKTAVCIQITRHTITSVEVCGGQLVIWSMKTQWNLIRVMAAAMMIMTMMDQQEQ